jgi:hypothetical protein
MQRVIARVIKMNNAALKQMGNKKSVSLLFDDFSKKPLVAKKSVLDNFIPNSKFRNTWIVLSCFAVFYNAFFITYYASTVDSTSEERAQRVRVYFLLFVFFVSPCFSVFFKFHRHLFSSTLLTASSTAILF